MENRTLTEKLREGFLGWIELYTLFDSIREKPYEKRIKQDSNFRAIVMQLENKGVLTKEQATIYRRQFYDPSYQLKI